MERMQLFGINTGAIKAAFQSFRQSTASLAPSGDPWVRVIVTFIQALAAAFGVTE